MHPTVKKPKTLKLRVAQILVNIKQSIFLVESMAAQK